MSPQSGSIQAPGAQGELSQRPLVKREKDGPKTVRYRCTTACPQRVHNDEGGNQ